LKQNIQEEHLVDHLRQAGAAASAPLEQRREARPAADGAARRNGAANRRLLPFRSN
jgi:hypothetical protein